MSEPLKKGMKFRRFWNVGRNKRFEQVMGKREQSETCDAG